VLSQPVEQTGPVGVRLPTSGLIALVQLLRQGHAHHGPPPAVLVDRLTLEALEEVEGGGEPLDEPARRRGQRLPTSGFGTICVTRGRLGSCRTFNRPEVDHAVVALTYLTHGPRLLEAEAPSQFDGKNDRSARTDGDVD